MHDGFQSGHELFGERRWRWQSLRLGLEVLQDVGQVEGARQMLHLRPMAPTRIQQDRHSRVGRRHQVLGLKLVICYTN